MRSDISRRSFLGIGLSALAAPAIPGCLYHSTEPKSQPVLDTHLTARPGTPTASATTGLSRLGIGGQRDGMLYVPLSYAPATPLPLFVALHGAGGSGSDWQSYADRAEARGFVLLAPDTRYWTWDVTGDTFGADVEFVDRALRFVFERCAIDPARVALAGFSDGASASLSLGLANGDLFTHLVGYSPGMVYLTSPAVGKPEIFVSHGTLDSMINVSVSRDGIVPYLRDAGYAVVYKEFYGGHTVPAEISEAALDWFFGVGAAVPPPAAPRLR